MRIGGFALMESPITGENILVWDPHAGEVLLTREEYTALELVYHSALITADIERVGIADVRDRCASALAKLRLILPPITPPDDR